MAHAIAQGFSGLRSLSVHAQTLGDAGVESLAVSRPLLRG